MSIELKIKDLVTLKVALNKLCTDAAKQFNNVGTSEIYVTSHSYYEKPTFSIHKMMDTEDTEVITFTVENMTFFVSTNIDNQDFIPIMDGIVSVASEKSISW